MASNDCNIRATDGIYVNGGNGSMATMHGPEGNDNEAIGNGPNAGDMNNEQALPTLDDMFAEAMKEAAEWDRLDREIDELIGERCQCIYGANCARERTRFPACNRRKLSVTVSHVDHSDFSSANNANLLYMCTFCALPFI